MTGSPLELTRAQIVAFRRTAGGLDERREIGPGPLRHAAWAGLQDSMPRAALLSIHARVTGAGPSAWEDPSLVQVWGPRYSVFVVAAQDIALFTLALLPDEAKRRQRAEDLAARLAGLLDDTAQSCRTLSCRAAGRALGVHPNSLRYASPTGTIALRWDGARQPVIRAVPRPGTDPQAARLALARRYLHVYGPATPEAFGQWSGIGRRSAVRAFEALTDPSGPQLVPVRTPVGEAWILTEDEAAARAEAGPPAAVRLLPSGDAFFLLQGADRALLVPDGQRRLALWTPRVWPGCLLVAGEVAGTWRRAGPVLTVQPWRPFSKAERAAVEAEAQSLPLPGGDAPTGVRWSE